MNGNNENIKWNNAKKNGARNDAKFLIWTYTVPLFVVTRI